MSSQDQLFGLILPALAVFVGWQRRAYPPGSLQEPGPGYTPVIIGAFLGITGYTLLLASVTHSINPTPQTEVAVRHAP